MSLGETIPGLTLVMLNEIITLRLTRNDAGQVIDGLTVCQENWKKTLDWYDGKLEDPYFPILECNDRDEAANMVRIYEDLLGSLNRQLLSQKVKTKV